MRKLLLADDEPLVLIGLQSMLRWETLGFEVCGTARNGEQALQMIEQHHPELVISDIKMPLKTGLEVLQACGEKGMELPVFIMLTSYEEFGFVKDAMHYGAVDYLVKLELSGEMLSNAVKRALLRIQEIEKNNESSVDTSTEHLSIQSFQDKFFVRLYNDLFDSREQFLLQKSELSLNFSSDLYSTAYCEICGINTVPMDTDKQMKLYSSTMQMVLDTVQKYMPCYCTSLDMRHFNLLLCPPEDNFESAVRQALEKAIQMARNYFSVQLLCAVGKPVTDAYLLSISYQSARHIAPLTNATAPLLLDCAEANDDDEHASFHMSLFRADLTRAFDELDVDTLQRAITEIVACLSADATHPIQAMDAASNLLYLAISLLPDGTQNMEQIFADCPDGYRSLYHQKTVKACCHWMLTLRDGLCKILQTRRQSYKERLVANVQEYLRKNLGKKLSLNEVAAVFNFSPNYLSQLFAQSSSGSFVEFITDARIVSAKNMLLHTDKKIYEIAEELGFESAFYFSKVFKKGTGMSPRDYAQAKKA